MILFAACCATLCYLFSARWPKGLVGWNPHLFFKVSARISLRTHIHTFFEFGGEPFWEGVVDASALCWRFVMPDSKPKPGQVQVLKDRTNHEG